MNKETNSEVFTLKETATFLKINPEVLRQNAKKGMIPGQLINNKWRFSKSAILTFLNNPHSPHT